MNKREAWRALEAVGPLVADAVRKTVERFGAPHCVEIEISGVKVFKARPSPKGKNR